jgi:hypothetical protein
VLSTAGAALSRMTELPERASRNVKVALALFASTPVKTSPLTVSR